MRLRNAGSVRPSRARKVFATFMVVLSRAATHGVTVRFRTGNGTAKAPSDYTRVNRTITFRKGQIRKAVRVRIKPNRPGEKVERFMGRLSDVRGAAITKGAGVAVIKKSSSSRRRSPVVGAQQGHWTSQDFPAGMMYQLLEDPVGPARPRARYGHIPPTS